MKISDYIIMSDVDGTLLPYGGEMPRRNIEALERFVAKGGKFGIATGRSKELIEEFVSDLPVNAPCIVHNGGGIYDFNNGEFLMRKFLPESAKNDVKTICEDVPDASVMVVADSDYYQILNESPLKKFSEVHNKLIKEAEIDTLTSPWYKVLFLISETKSASFDKYIASKSFKGIRFVYTNPMMVELLPAGTSKGSALNELARLGHIERERVAAVGDYYNDLEMIEFAAVGAATAEAPEDIKSKAKFVTGPCNGGAVADLVEYLESIASRE